MNSEIDEDEGLTSYDVVSLYTNTLINDNWNKFAPYTTIKST